MNILLKIHKELTEEDFKQLWENATFIFDTNVLLDLYRLQNEAKEDLLNLLSDEKLNGRIWLPFQVLLEFLNNRINTISSQKKAFKDVERILNKAKKGIEESYNEMKTEIEKMQLAKRHSSICPDEYVSNALVKEPIAKINQFIKDLSKLGKKQPDVNEKDALKNKIIALFDGKTGNSLSKEELTALYTEGDKRYAEKIPPGYLDIDKGKDDKETEYYVFEDKKYLRKFGDLIIWKEIIKKAKDDNLEFVVFVTSDSKLDWMREKDGKKLGARLELLNEIYFEANSVKLFHIYNTSDFMKYAKQYLSIDVKEQSITETEELALINNYNSHKSGWYKLFLENESEGKSPKEREISRAERLFNLYTNTKEDEVEKLRQGSLERDEKHLKFALENLQGLELDVYFSFLNENELLTTNEIRSRLRVKSSFDELSDAIISLVGKDCLIADLVTLPNGSRIVAYKLVPIW